MLPSQPEDVIVAARAKASKGDRFATNVEVREVISGHSARSVDGSMILDQSSGP